MDTEYRKFKESMVENKNNKIFKAPKIYKRRLGTMSKGVAADST